MTDLLPALSGQAKSAISSGDVQLLKATLQVLPGGGLRSMLGDEMPLKFEFNPEKIQISHQAKYDTKGQPVLDTQSQIASLGDVDITIDSIYFTGLGTKANCERLLRWSFPAVPESPAQDSQANAASLLFSWGELAYYVNVRSVTITYIRFGPGGRPTRAQVNLKLFIPNGGVGKPKGEPQNPTSGGPSGRRTRVLDSSGCLASVAYATYDRPGAWRLIAKANGIDDPLRVRAGTVLYLPERAEPEHEVGVRR